MEDKRYIEATGRRKTARARVRILEASKEAYEINGRSIASYFPTRDLSHSAARPFLIAGLSKKFSVSARIEGGGVHAQSDALAHGIARALAKYDPTARTPLKKAGLLTRDPRVKERKKPGLKGARRAAQWSKR